MPLLFIISTSRRALPWNNNAPAFLPFDDPLRHIGYAPTVHHSRYHCLYSHGSSLGLPPSSFFRPALRTRLTFLPDSAFLDDRRLEAPPRLFSLPPARGRHPLRRRPVDAVERRGVCGGRSPRLVLLCLSSCCRAFPLLAASPPLSRPLASTPLLLLCRTSFPLSKEVRSRWLGGSSRTVTLSLRRPRRLSRRG